MGGIFTLAGLFAILCLGVGFDEGKEFFDLVTEGELLDASRVIVEWVDVHYAGPVATLLTDPLSAKGFFFASPTRGEASNWWPTLVLLGSILWLIFVWSKFGGAITRILSLQSGMPVQGCTGNRASD